MNAPEYEVALRLLLWLPAQQEADHCCAILQHAGITMHLCRDIGTLCSEVELGAGVVLVTEDALDDERFDHLMALLRAQPAWSDIPLLLLCSERPEARGAQWARDSAINVSLLTRPLVPDAFLASVRSALRARSRQLHLRAQFEKQSLIEQALGESEGRFASFMDHLPAAAWIKERDGRYIYANVEAERIFARQFSELKGKTDIEVFPAETAREFLANDCAALAKGSIQTTEVLRQPDGIHHYSLVNKFVIPGAGTQDIGIGGVAFDITEQRHAQEALTRSEQRLRRFYESGMVGALYWNMDGAITDANDKFLEMIGYNREELEAGRIRWVDLTPPKYVPLDQHALHELRSTGLDTPYEKEYIRKDGTRVPVVVAAATLDEARHEGVAFVLDLTEKKRAEQALRHSEQRLAAIIESAMDAIVTADEQQRIVLFNPAAERMFGCSASDAIGSHIERFIPPRLREVHSAHMKDFARTGSTARAMGHLRPLSALRTDGTEFSIEASISRVQVEDHTMFTVILRDITERKRAQEAVASAFKEAQEASLAKDHFLAVLSHELRNPLAPVTTAVAILRRSLAGDRNALTLLDIIGRNIELEARLIDDLLDMTMIARGKVELDKRPVAPARSCGGRGRSACPISKRADCTLA